MQHRTLRVFLVTILSLVLVNISLGQDFIRLNLGGDLVEGNDFIKELTFDFNRTKAKKEAEGISFLYEPINTSFGEGANVFIKKTDFQELAKALKTQNSSLIKSCTMKGASHDELHKWLYPHIGFIKSLSSTNDSKEAEKIIIQIKESFETYQKYFE